MARRRSRNRRASRKSLNITELDEDSEHIDTHDALWWKNIEADMTVLQSRRPSYAETTAPILDGSSFVEASELRNDWWETLGRPSIEPSRRVSVRRSVRGADTRDESFASENSEEIDGRKSRTSRLRARQSANKVAGVASEPTIIGDSQETESSGRDEASRARGRPDETHEAPIDTSDAVPSSRPKPFKKRFAKIPDGTFDEFGNEAAGRKSAVDSSRGSQERRRADASLDATSRSAARLESEGLEGAKSPPVMGPPRNASLRKRRASSIARRHETTSEESEPDAESRKRRLRRKVRKTASIDPFDEVIVEATERSNESIKVSAVSENVEKVKRGPSQVGRNSLSRRIEHESSDKEDENHRDVSSETSHVRTKILEVSLTRMPLGKYRGDEKSRAEKSGDERKLRASRSTRPFIEDSAYELPNQERSTTPQISDSDDPKDQSPGNANPPRTTRRTPLTTGSARRNLAATSRRSLTRSNYSRTKIFSDEDISLEDLSYMERRGNLPEIEPTRASEKDVAARGEKSTRSVRSDGRSRRSATRSAGRSILANKSHLSRESDASSSEGGPEVEGGKNLTRRNSRGSRASASRKSEIRERTVRIERTIGQEGIAVAEEIDREAGHFGQARLRGNVDVSEKEPNHSRSQDESPESPDERNDLGKSHSEPPNSPSKGELRNGLRRSEIAESSDEPEVARMGPSNLSRTRENSRTSGRQLAAGESRRGIMFDESSSEDEEGAVERSYRQSGYPDTTEKSVGEKSVAEKSVGEKSVAEKLVREKSVAEKSVGGKSVAERSVAEKSVAEKSVAQKSVAERSVSKKSVTEKSFNSTTRRDSRRGIIQSGANTSESDYAEESPPRSKSRFKDVSEKGLAPVNESLDREDPVDEDEPEEDPSAELSPRESSRSPGRSSVANRSKRRTSIEQEPIRESEEIQNQDPESPPGAVKKSPVSKRFEEVEATAVRKSPRSRSFVADSSRQSVRELEKTRQNEKARLSTTERSSVAPEPSGPSGERTARKSTSSARASRNILTTSHASNLGDSVTRENWRMASSTPKVAARASIVGSSKTSTPARVQPSITDFYPSKFLQKSHESTTPRKIAPRFDPIKMREVKEKVEEMKRRELEAMSLQTRRDENSKKDPSGSTRKASPKKTSKKTTKIVDKAYIVNGKVYRRPKLPRPKAWATDRLYRHLWKRMEPKYESSTRVESEKFVLSLAEVVALTIRRKKYESYKPEVDALVKKMAELNIIRTLNDFYDFCYDFMPYDFRVKVTPILLPGNKVTIPYDPDKLHTPILRDT